MKIFDLEFLVLTGLRKFRARIRKAFLKKQLTHGLILRYLSILVIALNIFFANPSVSNSSKSKTGLVLSQETKAGVPHIPTPQRIAGSPEFDKFLGRAALVLDATTSAVLFEKNSSEKLPPASITKLMTSLVVVDAKNLTDEVTVSPECAKMEGTKVGFLAGQTFTVESLLYALLLPSASDAACALGTSLPSENPQASPSAHFVQAMNFKAAQLGLKDTVFVNSVGLDDSQQYSTAADLLLLSKKFMENPRLAKIAGTVAQKIASVDNKFAFDLRNTNELLVSDRGFLGIKTGTTPNAAGCLAFQYARNGRQIIGVVLGSPLAPQDSRFLEARNLVDWIFKSFEWK